MLDLSPDEWIAIRLSLKIALVAWKPWWVLGGYT